MEIETRNASLDLLAVTILALHVSGKQMTLAVFRQLPVGKESKDSELWGTVRYSIKDDGDLWLVFSTDGKLFKRPLYLSRPFRNTSLLRELESSSLLAFRKPDDPMRIEQEMKIENERIAVEKEYAAWVEKFNYEKSCSEMRQLFIAV